MCMCVSLYLLHHEDRNEYFTSKLRTFLKREDRAGLHRSELRLDSALWYMRYAPLPLAHCALITVDTLCGFLLGSVHLHFHDLQHVERYPLVFISVTSASFFPPLSLCFDSSLSEPVHCLSRTLIPWYRSLFSPLLASTPPPLPLSVSSSKWVFRCQCQSVGGGDESVALTVSLAMTISAHCLVSVGETFSTLCTIDLSSHHYTSQHFVNMMGSGVSVRKCLFISAYLTFLLCHIPALWYQNSHAFLKTGQWVSDIEDE